MTHIDLLMLAGAIAAVSLFGLLFARSAVRRAERTLGETMRAASTVVAEGLAAGDPDGALDKITAALAELLEADAAVIALPTDDHKLYCGFAYGYKNPATAHIRDDEGMCGYTFQTGLPLVARDVRKEPRYKGDEVASNSIRSAITVPLRYEARTLGVFDLESETREYTDRDLAVLVPLGDQIAAVIETLRLRRAAEELAGEERRERRGIEAVASVVMAGVSARGDLMTTLQSMLTEIASTLGWASLSVNLLEDDGLLHVRAHYGLSHELLGLAIAVGHGIVGKVAETGRGRLAPDVSQDPDYVQVASTTRSEMCMPMKVGDRVLGVLNVESPVPNAYSTEDFELLELLAESMAVVVERAHVADLEREALERLQSIDRLKDDFVATVSHELRTPLTSIKGFAQTMVAREHDLSPADRRAFLEVVVRQCDRLATIVDSLLLVSRLEAGEIGGKPSYLLVRDLIVDAGEGAGALQLAEIVIETRTGFVTDHFRVHHILRNLIENACKYSPRNAPIRIEANNEGKDLVVRVSDRGPGIPDGSEEAVFERFRRLADPGTSRVPGTGLGLYIARRFARDLGGDVTVSNGADPPWTGACFVLRLPEGSLPATVDATGRPLPGDVPHPV